MTTERDTTESTAVDGVLTETLRAQMPLAGLMRVHAIEATSDRVVLDADWAPEYCGLGGVLHGGFLMALADEAGATLAFVNLPPGASTTTLESKSNFVRPVTAGSVRATATLIHRGRTTMVAQTDIRNDDGSLVAQTTQTQVVRPPRID